jgi:hypothetical protein
MDFSKPKPQGPEEVYDDFGEEKVARLSKARKCVQNFNRKPERKRYFGRQRRRLKK